MAKILFGIVFFFIFAGRNTQNRNINHAKQFIK